MYYIKSFIWRNLCWAWKKKQQHWCNYFQIASKY